MMPSLLWILVFWDVSQSVVEIHVPVGSLYGAVDDVIESAFTSNVPVLETIYVNLSTAIEGAKTPPDVYPNPIVFAPGSKYVNFTIRGRRPGRYLFECKIFNTTTPMYALSQDAFVVFILNNQWYSVFYQIGLSTFIFLLGLAFFAWRRTWNVNLPLFGSHTERLFEQVPFRVAFTDTNDPLWAETMAECAKLFWQLQYDDKIVVERCGAEAALCLGYLVDAGHLFAILCVCSFALLLPTNFVSGGARSQSYQEATISNVPIKSQWLWMHVLMCYISAGAVIIFIYRQYKRLTLIQHPALLGPRSVYIKAGLPEHVTNCQLGALLMEEFPQMIDTVKVVEDLSDVYHSLEQRKALCNEELRLKHIYGAKKSGACLVWCSDVTYALMGATFDCTSIVPQRSKNIAHNLPIETCALCNADEATLPLRVRHRLFIIREKLEFYTQIFMSNLIQLKRTPCSAFVVFRSPQAKYTFLDLYTQSSTNFKDHLDAFCFSLSRMCQTNADHLHALNHSPNSYELKNVLKHLVVEFAPEPDDICWTHMASRVDLKSRAISIGFYQLITWVVLLVFSTPAAVLLYVNLDPSSPIYAQLLKDDSVATGFVRLYLPTLLLVIVNSLLLTILWYISCFEPWLTETKRMRSLLYKSFPYILMSSIIFPSIGVTALYPAGKQTAQIRFDSSRFKGNNYANDFLFNVCSNFFILYIAQMICLGTLMQMVRPERLLEQPWKAACAVTTEDIVKALRPAPYDYGTEYALILSVFLVALFGSTLSPALLPCGALYFYVRYFSTKYNFLYVHPKAPGRGNVFPYVLACTLACLFLFELGMTILLSQIGRHEQWLTVLVLTIVTFVVYVTSHVTAHDILEKALPPFDEQAAPLLEKSVYQGPHDAEIKMFRALYKAHSHQMMRESLAKWKSY
ncbi:hypothetical protein AeMF1_010189 [Aphanomyces euteiches]|nr:hypothetical protein AeMF1_010189 [Aphanomyces euteiches]KAH9194080.1 hypothetical protein AeNC1_003931 [Aphanomyces euteiches]